MNDTNYIFRKFYYVTIMLKKSKNDEIINNCLNIDCSLFEINRFKFNKHFVVNFTIKQLLLLLSIRDIDNTIHHISEYTVVSLYVDDYIVDQIDEKRFAIVKIQIEFHIVDDLKINILIENDVFRAQRITLNLKKQTIILINCRNFIIFINVTTKKNVDQKRIVRIKIDFKISFDVIVKMFIVYHNSLSKNRNYFFESQCVQQLKHEKNVFVHIFDATMNYVMMRNVI